MLVLILAFPCAAHATDYFVRTGGRDDFNGKSAATAFATIKRAAAVAQNGDTVYVGGGLYTDAVSVLGVKQAAQPLQFVADTEGARTGDSGPVVIAGAPLRVAGSNYIQFRGFTFSPTLIFPVIWENSFEGQLQDCTFQGCGQSLLMKDGSLTLDGCSLADFTSDAIQVDGAARLTLRGCTITGALRDGIAVRKNAVVSIEDSVVTNCTRDGLHVEVTDDVISLDGIPVDDCGCSGSSPFAMKQEAYDLMVHTYPADPVYQQALTVSASKIASSLAVSLWRDEQHLALSSGTSVYDRSKEAVEALFAAYSDDVEFEIVDGELVVKRPFKAEVTVLGAEITSGSYNVPVTARIQVGSTSYQPWGPFTSPTQGNVNDSHNPRVFLSPDTFPATERISVSGRSWLKVNGGYSGSQDSHWYAYITVDSSSGSPNVVVLRDGSAVPNYQAQGGQNGVATYLRPYVSSSGLISLAQNQAIFLFELGTTNLLSTAADFQDLVVLVTMKKEASIPLTPDEASRVKRAIDLLVAADRELAECAINEAAFAGGDSDILQAARQHYDDGVNQVASAEYKLASTAFGDAWEAAKAATGNREPDLSAALAERMAPSPPGSWTPVQEAAVSCNDSQLNHNGSGVAVLTPQIFTARNGLFQGNSAWGLTLSGPSTLQDCIVRDNAVGGLRLEQAADGQADFVNLQIQDNREYGVFLQDCHLSLDQTEFGHWSISGSDHIVASAGSTLTLDGVTIRGGRVAGVYSHGGALIVRNASFTENGYGIAAHQCDLTVDGSTLVRNTIGLYAREASSAAVRGSTIGDNRSWGATITAPAGNVAIETSVVEGNESGICFTDVANTQIALRGTLIRGNSVQGLYFERCDAAVSGAGSSGCQLQYNGIGISSRSGRLRLADLSIEDCGTYGCFGSDSDISLRNSVVSGACGVYVDGSNVAFTADAVRFRGAGDGALWGVVHGGGLMDVSNCIIDGFQSGVYAGGQSSRASILNSTLANSTTYGIFVAGGSVSIKNTILAGSGGGEGIHRAEGTLNHSHNLIHGFATPFSGTALDDTEIVKSPRFVDAERGDFRLAIGSPALNGGEDLSAQLPLDIAGNARCTFGACDIGAYESTDPHGSLRVLSWTEQK